VHFASGKSFDADDVVWTFHRLMSESALEMTGYVLYVTDVATLDPLTVRIRTTSPVSTFLNKLRFVLIVPKDAKAEDLAGKPDGTGAYELVAWEKGVSIRMRRSTRFPELREMPPEVEFHLDRSPELAVEDLLAGRSEIAQCRSRRAEAAVPKRYQVARRPSIFTKFLGFDVAHETTPFVPGRKNPFKSWQVRRAIHLAIDRKSLVDGLSHAAAPANQPIPPTIFGFDPALPAAAFDLAQARSLMAEAGVAGGFDVTLHVRKQFAEAAEVIARQLRELAIAVTVKPLPDEQFLSEMSHHEYSMYLSRFGCPTGDASEILDIALHSFDPAKKMGINNDGGYSNPEVDRAIEASARIEGLKERGDALRRIMDLVMQDVAWVPLYFDEDVYAIDPAIAWQPRNDSFILASEIRVR
jgi:peptide/nickel transport system substrate-binding protein